MEVVHEAVLSMEPRVGTDVSMPLPVANIDREFLRDLPPAQFGPVFWVQILTANIICTVLLALLSVYKFGYVQDLYKVLSVLCLSVSLPVYAMLRCYDHNAGWMTNIARVLSSWMLVFAALTVLGFLTKTSANYSREVLILWFGFGFALQTLSFSIIHRMAKRFYANVRASQAVAILGVGDFAESFGSKLKDNGHNFRGYFEPSFEENTETQNVIGNLKQLRAQILEQGIQKLYVATRGQNHEILESVYLDLLDLNVDIIWVPAVPVSSFSRQNIRDIDGQPAISLNDSPLASSPASIMLKSLMDKLGAAIILIGVSPIMLTAAAAIALNSRGPIFFRQQREGVNGEPFEILKFRSMYFNSGDNGGTQATRNDSRITPVGRFIRRTSIDELPQLINVLKGDMSLVGPRPHPLALGDYYENKVHAYMARHRIKPGITGLAQIYGLRGETAEIEKMQARVEYDVAYITHWSIYLDIKILLRTVTAVFDDAAY